MSESRPELRESLRQYATALGKLGWVVIACAILGDIVTLGMFVWAVSHAPTPEGNGGWIWLLLTLATLGLVVVPFMAFHSLRIARDKAIREKELQFEELENKNKDTIGGLVKKLAQASGELEQLRQKELRLIIDHDPKDAPFFDGSIRIIVKSDASSRTIHQVSLKLVEFRQVSGTFSVIDDPLPFALNEAGNTVVDLNAGNELRVPFLEFGEHDMIRVLCGNLQSYGNRNGVLYRITVLADGQNSHPARATFIAGFGRKGAFLNRINRVIQPNVVAASGVHQTAAESD